MQVICWVVGEYGRLAGRSEEGVMDALAAIPETQAGDDEVRRGLGGSTAVLCLGSCVHAMWVVAP